VQDHTRKLLSTLRERIPGLALRTTFICGFPGESEAQHRELVKVRRGHKFEDCCNLKNMIVSRGPNHDLCLRAEG
jgi:tRNA A37 methylthiotransferase MiaB